MQMLGAAAAGLTAAEPLQALTLAVVAAVVVVPVLAAQVGILGFLLAVVELAARVPGPVVLEVVLGQQLLPHRLVLLVQQTFLDVVQVGLAAPIHLLMVKTVAHPVVAAAVVIVHQVLVA